MTETIFGHRRWPALVLAAALVMLGGAADAQTTVRIAKQFGISYLPLTLMEEKKLLEEHGKRLGLDIKAGDTVWKYGQDIGVAKADIAKGEHVHIHNLKTKRW